MLDVLRPWRPVEVRATVHASPDQVFDLISEPRTYPDWLVGTKEIRSVDRAFPAAGASFHHSVGVGPVTLDDSTTVVEVGPWRRLELEVHLGPVHGDVELLVLPCGDGSEIRFRERPIGLGAILTPVLRPLLAARNARSLARLGDLLDQGCR